jgi:hypothetical protein
VQLHSTAGGTAHLLRHGSALQRPFAVVLQTVRVQANVSTGAESFLIPAAPDLIPDGAWKKVEGGVCAAKGFKATGTVVHVRFKNSSSSDVLTVGLRSSQINRHDQQLCIQVARI